MDEMFAKNFDIVNGYDVVGGQTLYTIDLTGEDGLISVYGIRKESCHIENETKEGADLHLMEILVFTRNDRMIERKLYEELKGYEIEYDEVGDEVPRYTGTGNEGKFKDKMTSEMKLRYENGKLVLKLDEEGNVLPKYDFEGIIIPDEERPEVIAYLAEQETFRLEAEALENENAESEEETGGE